MCIYTIDYEITIIFRYKKSQNIGNQIIKNVHLNPSPVSLFLFFFKIVYIFDIEIKLKCLILEKHYFLIQSLIIFNLIY